MCHGEKLQQRGVVGLEPKIAKREAQRYAGVRETLGRDELPKVVPSSLSTVFAFLQKHRVHVTGAPLIRYLVIDYNTGEIEIDVGVPVGGTTLPADARVESVKIPSGTFATLIHRGPYDALVQTTAALVDWAQKNNVAWAMVEQRKVTRWDGRVEHYLVGPPQEPNPKNWQTEIAILISDA
jgi:effector-binding domain-containing protein